MTTQKMGTRFLAGAVLAGGLAFTGVALTPGTAEAKCNQIGQCGQVWCPGQPLSTSATPITTASPAAPFD